MPDPDRHKRPRTGPKTNAKTGPFCNAKRRRREERCKQPAGYKTDHPGQGRCHMHGGCVPIKHGRYASVLHRSVKEALDSIAALETNVMDLEPEANLLRALTVDYINRYEEFAEALLAWYADSDDGEAKTKPRKIMDLADAGRLVEAISRVVHRIHQIQSTGAISLDTFRRVTEMMGVTVARHVKDEKVLNKIEDEWSQIALDAKTVRADEQDIEDGDDD